MDGVKGEPEMWSTLKRRLPVLVAGLLLLSLLPVRATTLTYADPVPGGDDNNVGLSEVVLGSVMPIYSATGYVSLSVDGLGTNSAVAEIIQVDKPAGATVRRAFLAAASTGFSGRTVATGDVKINGTNVVWSLGTPSSINSNNYWADVTSIVKPVVDAAPAGRVNFNISEIFTFGIDGEILAVVFDDPNQPVVNTVALLFGAQQVLGDTFALLLADPIDLTDPDFALDMSLGISYGFQSNFGGAQRSIVNVNGQRLTSSAGGEDDGASQNGALLTVGGLDDSTANPPNPFALPTNLRSDDELYNLLPFVQNGQTSVNVFTQNPSVDDNIFFAAFNIKSAVAIIGEGIVLAPTFASNPVGVSHTVQATVQDSFGGPVANRNVDFTIVSGPHAGQTGSSLTDSAGQASFTYTGLAAGTDVIEASFVDSQGNTQFSNRVVAEWISTNNPPSVDAGGPYSVDEGGSVLLTATGSDPDGGPLTYAWDLDANGTYETPGQSVTFSAASLDGPSSHIVAVRITDDHGATDLDAATVNVLNVAPTAGPVSGPTAPVLFNTAVTLSSPFTDPGIPDTHTAVWDWGDGSTTAGTVTEANGSGSVSDSPLYASAGVYTVQLTVTDDDGDSGSATFQYVVVYNPDGGFVTGGGWIDSPAGAYYPDPTLTGRANFGFVSKYLPNRPNPQGSTEFQFRAASLNFRSTSYDVLVISGFFAQYRGTGTINGAGDYSFILTAVDGQQPGGGGVDKFRIKIMDSSQGNQVVYDNQLGAPDRENPTTALGGGSVVIHRNP
jgi:hypothetical protein